MSKVSVIIPVYNNLKITIDCLGDLLKTCGCEIEIIVVDDCSKREPISKIIPKLFPQVKVITNDTNLGFAKAVNRGIKAASSDLVCLLNNDVRLSDPAWLKNMIVNLKSNDLGLTSAAFGRLSLPNYEYISGEAKLNSSINKKEFTYPVFWCVLINKMVFDKIGFLSEAYGKGFFDDVEFSYRAKKAGFKMNITEGTGVVHAYHTTFKSEGINLGEQYAKNRKIFLKETGGSA